MPENGAVPVAFGLRPILPIAWRGVILIAGTYVYFLIFAQFGFLNRLAELGIGQGNLTPIMASMAAGGVLSSLFGRRLLRSWGPATRLHVGLLGCAAAAGLSMLPLNPACAGIVSALIGVSLGVLTVALVASLRLWTGTRHALWTVATGTGLGYFVCNVPALFTAPPRTAALVSGLGCLFAAAVAKPRIAPDGPGIAPVLEFGRTEGVSWKSFLGPLLAFTALIWLDSAAFFIIQNSPTLKAGTWAGTLRLWQNGGIHLGFAFAAVWLLRRRGLHVTLLAAFGCIAAACLLLHDPRRAAIAALFYPAGVSIYSVALVAYPSLLLQGASQAEREQTSGILYAVAGWIGSALGIGMGQHLHRVPTLFLAVAGIAVAGPILWRRFRTNKAPALAAGGVVLLAYALDRTLLKRPDHPAPASSNQIARGRQVYISEGCIHCHSQYVRPHDDRDLTLWGPSRDLETIRREHPPLIGNRRQGPDLSEVGSRRSPLWLRMHFMDPRAVSYQSIMPSYKTLFSDGRGDALVAYVSSLRSPDAPAHLRTMLTSWTPGPGVAHDAVDGATLFQQHCATCHLAGGQVRRTWAGDFRQLPPDLFVDTLALLPREAPPAREALTLERIIKFGVPGTDMPGHEYLPDTEIVALASWVLDARLPQRDLATTALNGASSTGSAAPPAR